MPAEQVRYGKEKPYVRLGMNVENACYPTRKPRDSASNIIITGYKKSKSNPIDIWK
jgi:hypothetical protein